MRDDQQLGVDMAGEFAAMATCEPPSEASILLRSDRAIELLQRRRLRSDFVVEPEPYCAHGKYADVPMTLPMLLVRMTKCCRSVVLTHHDFACRWLSARE